MFYLDSDYWHTVKKIHGNDYYKLFIQRRYQQKFQNLIIYLT